MIKLKNINLGDKLNQNLSQALNSQLKKTKAYKQKLKELKTWAQVKSPKALQPALSYTLDWLSPELLGTGFRMSEVSDFAVQALVPSQTENLDYANQIHQGLIVNAAMELARNFICRHLPESFFQISESEIKISKQQKWNDDITLSLQAEEVVLDQFFTELQDEKKTTVSLRIFIQNKNFTKDDTIDLQLTCEATNLLA